ncbi:hypothetical protein COCSUDRAFT_55103 [Coccomyxa subellipsoidea C-169]|uniref:Uncharacterized protein n=1 Tax=Coccomyxa subellipsoidea (strain C-169) TaxID=574566 RepID=I0Z8W1_COCSC|nr:hypothetical protein COCSUDRAFT_55103 [Coccomyxa subellipsoidea C-169]EIE27080.1 hypothetical protein COCSUDRAFT_55103 [Coccomyxa subellipsoidea C-169]|eukprot:XP_005651624.1 hypothetical protein COCSUDRAFT_55103 [Coccomyxa subellipsoidea C-169]
MEALRRRSREWEPSELQRLKGRLDKPRCRRDGRGDPVSGALHRTIPLRRRSAAADS